jgi:hypothetical protein
LILDLEEVLSLIRTECESQGSVRTARSEALSDLELDFPANPQKRKDFDSLVPHSKRQRTNDIYLSLIDASAREDIPVWKMAAYLGKRSAYGCNKEIARQFDNILLGSSTNDVDTSLAIFLKEYCQIGRSVYTDLCMLLKGRVEFPSWLKMTQEISTFLPSLEPWENGILANFEQAVDLTLQRVLMSTVE